MDLEFRQVRRIDKHGDSARVEFETASGDSQIVLIPMSRLWEIASELRQASIHLLAPVPLYNPSAHESKYVERDDESERRSAKRKAAEAPTGGFAAVEEAWEICDRLNAPAVRAIENLDEVYTRIVSNEQALDQGSDNLDLLKTEGYVKLRSGLVIRFRSDSRDWVPDRLTEENGPND